MSYGITRRTNEFGIRMALGAGRWDVLWVVLRETLSLAIAGVGIRLALAVASGQLVESLLFGLKPSNPLVMGLSMSAMIVVVLIDPSVALRHE